MPHVRRQIVAAAKRALSALSTVAAANVHAGRAAPVASTAAPYLLLYAREERAESVSSRGQGDRRLQRVLTLVVEAVTAEAADSDELIDAIALEVETALAADPTLGDLAKDLVYSGIAIDGKVEGESRTGIARIEFTILYHTSARAADTPLQ